MQSFVCEEILFGVSVGWLFGFPGYCYYRRLVIRNWRFSFFSTSAKCVAGEIVSLKILVTLHFGKVILGEMSEGVNTLLVAGMSVFVCC